MTQHFNCIIHSIYICICNIYLDRFAIARQCDVAQRLAVQQRCEHARQIRRMVVPAQTVLLVAVHDGVRIPVRKK